MDIYTPKYLKWFSMVLEQLEANFSKFLFEELKTIINYPYIKPSKFIIINIVTLFYLFINERNKTLLISLSLYFPPTPSSWNIQTNKFIMFFSNYYGKYLFSFCLHFLICYNKRILLWLWGKVIKSSPDAFTFWSNLREQISLLNMKLYEVKYNLCRLI